MARYDSQQSSKKVYVVFSSLSLPSLVPRPLFFRFCSVMAKNGLRRSTRFFFRRHQTKMKNSGLGTGLISTREAYLRGGVSIPTGNFIASRVVSEDKTACNLR